VDYRFTAAKRKLVRVKLKAARTL